MENLVTAAKAARYAGTSVWDWAEKRKIAAHIVMAVAIGLTIRIAEWAIDFPYAAKAFGYGGQEVAYIQAAVLGPWGLMQGAMFKFYVEMIKET